MQRSGCEECRGTDFHEVCSSELGALKAVAAESRRQGECKRRGYALGHGWHAALLQGRFKRMVLLVWLYDDGISSVYAIHMFLVCLTKLRYSMRSHAILGPATVMRTIMYYENDIKRSTNGRGMCSMDILRHIFFGIKFI